MRNEVLPSPHKGWRFPEELLQDCYKFHIGHIIKCSAYHHNCTEHCSVMLQWCTLLQCYRKCDILQAPSDWVNKDPKVQRAENESRVFIMKAGVLLIQRLKWEKGRNKERKKSLRGFWKDDITDLTALEVLDLSVLFVMIEHSVLLGVESKLKGFGKSSVFIIHQARFAMKDLPFAPHFPLQGEGISCRAVVSNIELWVRRSSARLCKIRLCKIRLVLAASKDLNLSVPLVSAMSAVGSGYLLLR